MMKMHIPGTHIYTNTHFQQLAEAEAIRLSWQPFFKGVIGQENDVQRNVCGEKVCKFATHNRKIQLNHTGTTEHKHIHTLVLLSL